VSPDWPAEPGPVPFLAAGTLFAVWIPSSFCFFMRLLPALGLPSIRCSIKHRRMNEQEAYDGSEAWLEHSGATSGGFEKLCRAPLVRRRRSREAAGLCRLCSASTSPRHSGRPGLTSKLRYL